MRTKKLLHYISMVMLFSGLLFAMLPHALHEKADSSPHPEHEEDHMIHVIYGISLAIIGITLMVVNEKYVKR
jgi:hypothetical protein